MRRLSTRCDAVWRGVRSSFLRRQLALATLLLLTLGAAADTKAKDLVESWRLLPKEDKVLYSNVAIATAIAAWGTYKWDYFKTSPTFESEGWFAEDTKEGGADKLGHLWFAYAASHGLGALYRHWGYKERAAGKLGALSSLGLTTLMEVGDSFSSKYGFSYEDAAMNAVGAGVGYLLWTRPDIARWIDLRVEWEPNSAASDIFTDYDNLKYLIAVKLEAAPSLRTSPLRFLELHAGYYARGYSRPAKVGRQRNLYVGIGINVSQILREVGHPRVGRFFNYVQAPYTYVSASRNLND